jgi:redox-sensitive bicupin YhaK (pirin superfamily)
MAAGQKAALPIPEGRLGWVQVISGELVLEDGQRVGPGDGLAIKDRAQPAVVTQSAAELLVFDLKP